MHRSVLATKQTITPSKGLRWLAQPDAGERPGGSSDWLDGGSPNVPTINMGNFIVALVSSHRGLGQLYDLSWQFIEICLGHPTLIILAKGQRENP